MGPNCVNVPLLGACGTPVHNGECSPEDQSLTSFKREAPPRACGAARVSVPPAPIFLDLPTIRRCASLWSAVRPCQQQRGGSNSRGPCQGPLVWFWDPAAPMEVLFVVRRKVALGGCERSSTVNSSNTVPLAGDDEALLDSHAPPCVVPSQHSPLPASASPCVRWLAPVHMRGHLRISVIVEAELAPCLRLLAGWRYRPLHQRVFRVRFRHVAPVSYAQS